MCVRAKKVGTPGTNASNPIAMRELAWIRDPVARVASLEQRESIKFGPVKEIHMAEILKIPKIDALNKELIYRVAS